MGLLKSALRYILEQYLLGYVYCDELAQNAAANVKNLLNPKGDNEPEKSRVNLIDPASGNVVSNVTISNWLTTSDAEKTEFFNAVIGKLWPLARTRVAGLKTELEQLLLRNTWLPFSVNIKNVELGDFPVIITRVTQASSIFDCGEYIFDIDLMYNGNASISIGATTYGGGEKKASGVYSEFTVKELELTTKARLVLKPVIEFPFLFAGATFSLLTTPSIDLNIVREGNTKQNQHLSQQQQDEANEALSMFDRAFKRALLEVLKSYLFHPNSIDIPLVRRDVLPIKHDVLRMPQGVVRITLHSVFGIQPELFVNAVSGTGRRGEPSFAIQISTSNQDAMQIQGTNQIAIAQNTAGNNNNTVSFANSSMNNNNANPIRANANDMNNPNPNSSNSGTVISLNDRVFEFYINDSCTDAIELKLKNSIGHSVGYCSVSIGTVAQQGRFDAVLPLKMCSSTTVALTAQWLVLTNSLQDIEQNVLELGSAPFETPAGEQVSCALLAVYVDCLRDILLVLNQASKRQQMECGYSGGNPMIKNTSSAWNGAATRKSKSNLLMNTTENNNNNSNSDKPACCPACRFESLILQFQLDAQMIEQRLTLPQTPMDFGKSNQQQPTSHTATDGVDTKKLDKDCTMCDHLSRSPLSDISPSATGRSGIANYGDIVRVQQQLVFFVRDCDSQRVTVSLIGVNNMQTKINMDDYKVENVNKNNLAAGDGGKGGAPPPAESREERVLLAKGAFPLQVLVCGSSPTHANMQCVQEVTLDNYGGDGCIIKDNRDDDNNKLDEQSALQNRPPPPLSGGTTLAGQLPKVKVKLYMRLRALRPGTLYAPYTYVNTPASGRASAMFTKNPLTSVSDSLYSAKRTFAEGFVTVQRAQHILPMPLPTAQQLLTNSLVKAQRSGYVGPGMSALYQLPDRPVIKPRSPSPQPQAVRMQKGKSMQDMPNVAEYFAVAANQFGTWQMENIPLTDAQLEAVGAARLNQEGQQQQSNAGGGMGASPSSESITPTATLSVTYNPNIREVQVNVAYIDGLSTLLSRVTVDGQQVSLLNQNGSDDNMVPLGQRTSSMQTQQQQAKAAKAGRKIADASKYKLYLKVTQPVEREPSPVKPVEVTRNNDRLSFQDSFKFKLDNSSKAAGSNVSDLVMTLELWFGDKYQLGGITLRKMSNTPPDLFNGSVPLSSNVRSALSVERLFGTGQFNSSAPNAMGSDGGGAAPPSPTPGSGLSPSKYNTANAGGAAYLSPNTNQVIVPLSQQASPSNMLQQQQQPQQQANNNSNIMLNASLAMQQQSPSSPNAASTANQQQPGFSSNTGPQPTSSPSQPQMALLTPSAVLAVNSRVSAIAPSQPRVNVRVAVRKAEVNALNFGYRYNIELVRAENVGDLIFVASGAKDPVKLQQKLSGLPCFIQVTYQQPPARALGAGPRVSSTGAGGEQATLAPKTFQEQGNFTSPLLITESLDFFVNDPCQDAAVEIAFKMNMKKKKMFRAQQEPAVFGYAVAPVSSMLATQAQMLTSNENVSSGGNSAVVDVWLPIVSAGKASMDEDDA